MRHWTIAGGVLSLEGDSGEPCSPSASCAREALGYGDEPPVDVANPSEDLPGISFSRFGARLSIVASMDGEGNCTVRPSITRRGRELECPELPVPVPEHVICEGQWVYFSAGRDETNDAFAGAAITSFGSITLAQYCALVQSDRAGTGPSINDDVLAAMSEHPVAEAEVPGTLEAKLYPYQEVGYKWLSFMAGQTKGCVLGDEMGLGKTLQVISLLLARHEAGLGTSLVVVPVSLMENWRRELARFAPTLDVLVHHGASRPGSCAVLESYDVVVLSYGSAVSDLGMLLMGDWDVLVLDEAQNIKNPDSKRSASVKRIPHRFGVAVSGTPFENHVLDVWSIMEFAEPGLLGSRRAFEGMYSDDLDGAARLEAVITPFILRRRVSEVAKDLPRKIDIPVPLRQLESEAAGYERVREQVAGETTQQAATLATLTRLRMFCTHPLVMDGSEEGAHRDPLASSAKYQYLCTLLGEIVPRGEKVLIFTSYRRMFSIFSSDLAWRFGVRVFQIDGSTPPDDRQGVVDEFSSTEGGAVLVLNPTAAGTGLNITSARNVIHYNLEWNPAKEDQATARSYRRGQDRTVFVYRLYYVDTVEEAILERMDLKRAMADSAIVGTVGEDIDRRAIAKALSASPVGR